MARYDATTVPGPETEATRFMALPVPRRERKPPGIDAREFVPAVARRPLHGPPPALSPVAVPVAFVAGIPPSDPVVPDEAQARAVFALLACVFAIAGGALLAAWHAPADAAPPPPAVPSDVGTMDNPDDTGWVPEPDPVVVKTPGRVKPTLSGPLSVHLGSPGAVVAVEVACPGDWRGRAAVDAGGNARLGDVPSGACTLWFRGGPPAQFRPVGPGMALDCNLVASTAVCVDRRS